MKQLLAKSILLLLLCSVGMLNAQNVIWSENFSGGIPAGWQNTDGSNQGVLWKWCADNSSGCAPVFTGEEPFNSTSAATGFVHVNSDAAGPLAQNHVCRLRTSAIDCSGKGTVFVKFESHIGTFDATPATSAVLRVSTNGTTWQNFPLFQEYTENNSFSENPTFSVVDISTVAANKSTVYLQWQWTGNWEYMWDLDDIQVLDANPTPANDLAIGDFFYPASSAAQPVSQIRTDTFGFYAFLTNKGSEPQTNIKLKATVSSEAGDLLFADSLIIPSLAVGVKDSVFELAHAYAPELPVGVYTVTYTLSTPAGDARPGDNKRSNIFYVTSDVFSKEDTPEFATGPAGGGDWYIANLYKMGTGSLEQYKATAVQFACASTDTVALSPRDIQASVFLLRVNDDIPANFAGFDDADFISSSTEWIGYANYEAADTAQSFDLNTVELLDINTSETGVKLDNGARYLVAVGYADASNVAIHAFNDNFNMFFISTAVFTDQWYLGGFGTDLNAVIRMGISLVTTTDEKPLPATAMQVFPNPVRETLNLQLDFAAPTNATITIADLSGRVIQREDRQGLTGETLQYNLPQLATGTYLARIATAEGTLTKKFVVQK